MTTVETVETINCRRGTVTLTTTETAWIIRGVHNTRTFRGLPAVYTVTLARCDCRTNPEAMRLEPSQRGGKPTARSNWGIRPLCTKAPEHNDSCHRLNDHCRAWRGHDDAAARRILADVAKSYNTAMPSDASNIKAILTEVAHSHRVVLTGAERVEFDACRVVDAA